MNIKFTIQQFNTRYPNDDVCLQEVFNARYGTLTHCPQCAKETKFYRVVSKKVFSCAFCGYQISPLADTIFHKSSTSLYNWFFVLYLFSTSRNGVSAKELQRQTGVTYKTAWRMAKQIRQLFDLNSEELKGIIEVDETYIGGKHEGKRGRGSENKTPVVGMVERKGKVKASVTANTKRSTVVPLVRTNVELGSNIMTDEYLAYASMKKEGYLHSTVNHGGKEYVRGGVHTNTIEGFWSLMKRSIDGTYHKVSPKYLQSYVNEFVYRYNHRLSSSAMFDLLLGQVVTQSV